VKVSLSVILALGAAIGVGALVALQPPINSELGRRTSDLGAAFVSIAVSFLVMGLIFLVFGDLGSLKGLGSVSPLYLTGGLYGVAFVAISLVAVRYLGVGGFVVSTVAAQVIVGALLDRAGVLGLETIPLTPVRLLGFLALIIGTILVTLR
jgi:bacterial/archaeal transporter family-2 protein